MITTHGLFHPHVSPPHHLDILDNQPYILAGIHHPCIFIYICIPRLLDLSQGARVSNFSHWGNFPIMFVRQKTRFDCIWPEAVFGGKITKTRLVTSTIICKLLAAASSVAENAFGTWGRIHCPPTKMQENGTSGTVWMLTFYHKLGFV